MQPGDWVPIAGIIHNDTISVLLNREVVGSGVIGDGALIIRVRAAVDVIES